MAQTNYAAVPDSKSAAILDRYYDCTVSWEAPSSSLGVMTRLLIGFTTNKPGHYVYINYTNASGTVYGIKTIDKNSAYSAGDYTYEIPSSYWSTRSSGTCKLRFKRPDANAITYTNIRFIVEYNWTINKSTVVVDDATAGNPQTVNLTNPVPTVYHWVNWGYGNNLSFPTVTSGSIQYGAETRSPAWAVPSEQLSTLYNEFPNSSYIDGRVLVDTMAENGQSVGDQAVLCRLAIPQNNDTLPELSLAITKTQDEIAVASGEDYLQGHTTLNVRPVATAKASATIQDIAITTPDGTFEGENNTDKSILLTSSGEYSVSVVVTDSRGFTATATTSITVTPCVAPAFSSLTVERCDSEGTLTDEGRYVKITATSSETIASWDYSISQSGKDSVVESGTLTNGYGVVGGGLLNPDVVYIVSITATDTITQSVTASVNVGTTLYTLHRMAGGKGVAFGKVANNYGVEVEASWPFITHGQEIQQLILDFAHPIGSVIQTLDETFDPNVKWPWSHWSRLENVFLLGSGSGHSIFETGGSETGAVDVDIRVKEQPFYITKDHVPENTLMFSYSGNRSTVNKLANTGSALRYMSDDPYPLFTMRLGTPQFIVQYTDTAPKDYSAGEYTYRSVSESRVYYRCVSAVASGSAWTASQWEEVQYNDIKDEIAVQIMWTNQEKVPVGGFAIGDYAYRVVGSESKLYRAVKTVAAYSGWSGDAEYKFVEVPYGDAKASATVSTMPPYLTVNIWVRSR